MFSCMHGFVKLLACILSMVVIRQPTTITFYDCFDFEMGTVINTEPFLEYCNGPDWDMYYAFNATTDPHAYLFHNQSAGTQVAFTALPYDRVDIEDVTTFTFQNELASFPFTQVAVVITSEGNYYKVQLIREDSSAVTFQLVRSSNTIVPYNIIRVYTPTVTFRWERLNDIRED